MQAEFTERRVNCMHLLPRCRGHREKMMLTRGLLCNGLIPVSVAWVPIKTLNESIRTLILSPGPVGLTWTHIDTYSPVLQ